ncbi:MAG: hypothetical protein MZV63_18715 [Marinilabiliales bacterium]|nr:hypothetical protein [Marinilabiliales bacterium]
MNGEGAKTWQRMTRDNIGRCIAVVLDDYVRSYPRVQNEIAGGNTEITGDFTLEEAEDLANILKSGKDACSGTHHLRIRLWARHLVRRLSTAV